MTEDEIAYLLERNEVLGGMVTSLREQLATAAVHNAEVEALLRRQIASLARQVAELQEKPEETPVPAETAPA